jgi:hypothetical protein
VLAHLLGEQFCVMNTLSARANFLSTHEHVVGVREEWVGRGRHRVRRPDGKGELVEGVEVGIVFLEDELSKVLFLWCTG